MHKKRSFEDVVLECRKDPEMRSLIEGAYLDEDVRKAFQRFMLSEEWSALRDLIPEETKRILDFGAGRGFVSAALASVGYDVTALEPDPSNVVGSGCLEQLVHELDVPVRILKKRIESASLARNEFDMVYCRAVLHHVDDLPSTIRHIFRITKPGGVFIASREHVIGSHDELHAFLESSPMHRMHHGENALIQEQYENAIMGAGFKINEVLGHYDSPVNYHPMSHAEWAKFCRKPLCEATCYKLGNAIANESWSLGRCVLKQMAKKASARCRMPGRLYTWVAQKP